MANLFVKPGNVVEHDGVRYGEGEKAGVELPGLTERQAKALLDANVVQTSDPAGGASQLDTHVPTDEEIAAAAAAAGQPSEAKKGIFGLGGTKVQ